jgi:Tol biopolymer transport system component
MRAMRTTEDSAKSLWQLTTLLALVLAASVLLLVLAGFKAASAATPKANGSIAYATNLDPTIYTINEAGGVPAAVDGSSIGGDIHGLAFSPDAAEIAFSAKPIDGAPMIYTVPATGGVAKPLIDEGPLEIHDVTWSPDGTKIAYYGWDPTYRMPYQIFSVPSRGGLPTPISDDPWDLYDPDWSPDGTQIVYSARDLQGNTALYTISPTGGTPTLLYDPPGSEPAVKPDFSPDGTKVAFLGAGEAGSGGNGAIYTIPTNGGTPTKVADGGQDLSISTGPSFSPDGTKIAFGCQDKTINGGSGNTNYVCTIPSIGGTPTKLNMDALPSPIEFIDWGVASDEALDSTAPTISLTTPSDGATYKRKALINAAYSCADETGGSGLNSCSAPVPDGSAIDTSTTGTKIFKVIAEDNAGNTNVVTHTYYVTKSGKVR